ncbi:MAG: hypothetical protein JXR95_03165 [Deltaproteobacteria bacterium]|nr:hypothetical protein [Deltaproteobacteria bacterium]
MKVALFVDSTGENGTFFPEEFLNELFLSDVRIEIFARQHQAENKNQLVKIHPYDSGFFKILTPSSKSSGLLHPSIKWKKIIDGEKFDLVLGVNLDGFASASINTDNWVLPYILDFTKKKTGMFRRLKGNIFNNTSVDLGETNSIITGCNETMEQMISRGIIRNTSYLLPLPLPEISFIDTVKTKEIGCWCRNSESIDYAVLSLKMMLELGYDYFLRIYLNQGNGIDLSAISPSLKNNIKFRNISTYKSFIEDVSSCSVFLNTDVTGENGDRDFTAVYSRLSSLAGVAQVASCHGAYPDVIEEGITGFLIPERNIEAVTDRCLEILTTHQSIDNMGKNARAKIEYQFDNRKLAHNLAGFLHHLVART